MRRRWEGVICLIATHTHSHTHTHPAQPISHSAQGWQAFTFKRLLWKAPLQCRRFQPQLYGEYIVVKLLMKMEESVYSSKQLSVKDGGSNLFSLRGAVLFPPLIATALMKSLHTWGEWFRRKVSGNILDVALKWKSQFFTLSVCLRVWLLKPIVDSSFVWACANKLTWTLTPKHTDAHLVGRDTYKHTRHESRSKHVMEHRKVKTYSTFMHECLCVLTLHVCAHV